MIKNMPAKAGDIRDVDLIPGSGRSPGRGHGYPFQYSCLENPHGQRSLVGYSPQGRKESNMTERTTVSADILSKSIDCLTGSHNIVYFFNIFLVLA